MFIILQYQKGNVSINQVHTLKVVGSEQVSGAKYKLTQGYGALKIYLQADVNPIAKTN